MPSRSTRAAIAASLAVGTLAMSGCLFSGPYKPGGSQSSLDQFTYISEPHSPKTVEIIDTRTNEVVWAMDVPVGKQLTFRFHENKEPDNIYAPALMRWDIYEPGTDWGRKRNALMVPGASARRIDMTIREGVEYPPEQPVAGAN